MTTTTLGVETTHEPLAQHAHCEAVLRCWLRESCLPVTGRYLDLPVPGSGARVVAEVLHRSATGMHRFGDIRLVSADGDRRLATATELAEMLAQDAEVGERSSLVLRVAESVHNLAAFAGREERPSLSEPLFLAGERALVLGHRLHPAPKSRGGLAPEQVDAWSPERTGRFRLHWFEVDEALVDHDHRDSPALRGRSTPELLTDLAGVQPAPGRVLVPAHPWQAADAVRRTGLAELVADGRVRPLGPRGEPWWATSSLRTVFRPDQPVMLKLSLGLPITNSVREATPTELRRGLEVHDLLEAGHLDVRDRAFRVVRDPAWLAVTDPTRPETQALTGIDVSVREVPPGQDRLVCLAGLLSPSAPTHATWGPSLLAQAQVPPTQWLADYVDRVLVPMLELYAATGVGLEAHQQNTLVRLDRSGRVTGGAYRDNQGYYLATSRLAEVQRVTGRAGSTLAVVDDAVVDDRLTYYLLHNQALSVVGSLGAEGLADERELLAVLRQRLEAALPDLAGAGPAGPRLVGRWLTAPSLPCKANLATRLRGIDEVTAPLDAQSVYLNVPNPLVVTR